MEDIRRIPGDNGSPTARIDVDILRRGIRSNMIRLGIVMGTGTGLALFLLTHLSLSITGELAGRYLNLLGIFFPGYSASFEGAWVGLFWGFVIGAISGSYVYYMYARMIGPELGGNVEFNSGSGRSVEQPVLLISMHEFALVLGSLMALQLFFSTMWLVLWGTPNQSPNAALLANYFPGYTVSFTGGLIGAAYIFVVTYLHALVLAAIYNRVASRKNRATSR